MNGKGHAKSSRSATERDTHERNRRQITERRMVYHFGKKNSETRCAKDFMYGLLCHQTSLPFLYHIVRNGWRDHSSERKEPGIGPE